MNSNQQIRADFDRQSIVVYQAYGKQIASASMQAGCFVAPFSWRRMTWIKPSFLWLMARSNWGTKSGQQNILAIRIRRSGWEKALSQAVLTCFQPDIHRNATIWRNEFDSAPVHVQWDPERSLQGKKLPMRSIQVGLSRSVIREFTDQWVMELSDMTAQVRKIRKLALAGKTARAKALLPRERVYEPNACFQQRLGMFG